MQAAAKETIIRISTNETASCRLCNFTPYRGSPVAFEDVCNHLIKEHGLQCLHIGQETTHGPGGNPWHSTVAVFGR
jgi:hypothetical protein